MSNKEKKTGERRPAALEALFEDPSFVAALDDYCKWREQDLPLVEADLQQYLIEKEKEKEESKKAMEKIRPKL